MGRKSPGGAMLKAPTVLTTIWRRKPPKDVKLLLHYNLGVFGDSGLGNGSNGHCHFYGHCHYPHIQMIVDIVLFPAS